MTTESPQKRKSRSKHQEPDSTRPPRWPWILFAVALIFAGYVRIRLLQIPLERDEGEFAYMGQLMLRGIPPYKIAFNMKMPGIYAAYALIMLAFGQTIAGIHLGFTIVNLATIAMVFQLTRRLFGIVAAGAASLVYALLSVYTTFLGTSAHATHFVVAFALAAILVLMKAIESKRAWLYFVSGLLFGLSFLMKQPGGIFGIFAFAYVVVDEVRNRSRLSQAVSRLGLLALGGVFPLAVTVLLLWKAGVLSQFYFWTVTYLRSYATQVPVKDAPAMFWDRTRAAFSGSWYIVAIAFVGLIAAFLRRDSKSVATFMLGFLVASLLAVCPGFYFRQHYYVLVLPPIAILSGFAFSWAILGLSGTGRLKLRALFPAALFAAALIYPISLEAAFLFSMPKDRASRHIYGANPFAESIQIADYIRSHSGKDDTIAVLGSEPQIYFYANRRAAITYIYMYPLMEEHPFARKMQLDLIKQVEAARPKYIVFVGTRTTWCKTPASDQSIYRWIPGYGGKHYELVGLVEAFGEDWIESYWDDDVEGRLPNTEYYTSVFRRKEP